MIKELQNQNYKEVLSKESKPYLLEFYTQWCGVCKQVAPILEEVAQEQSGQYGFYKANAEEVIDLVNEYGIRSVPTFFFIQDGNVKNKHTGYISKEDLIAKLKISFS